METLHRILKEQVEEVGGQRGKEEKTGKKGKEIKHVVTYTFKCWRVDGLDERTSTVSGILNGIAKDRPMLFMKFIM